MFNHCWRILVANNICYLTLMFNINCPEKYPSTIGGKPQYWTNFIIWVHYWRLEIRIAGETHSNTNKRIVVIDFVQLIQLGRGIKWQRHIRNKWHTFLFTTSDTCQKYSYCTRTTKDNSPFSKVIKKYYAFPKAEANIILRKTRPYGNY